MSLFDAPKQDKLSDLFPMGDKFWLLEAKYEGFQPTAYGTSSQASVVVCAPGDLSNTRQFRVWGVLADQIQSQGEDDLPSEVYIGAQGRKHVWVPVRKLSPEEVAGAAPPTEVETGSAEDIPY